MEKLIENFLNTLRKENVNELVSKIVRKDLKNYPAVDKVLSDTSNLEKAIEAIINENNEKFPTILKVLVEEFIEKDKQKAIDFLKSKLEEFDKNRYERYIFILKLLYIEPQLVEDEISSFIDDIEDTNLKEEDKVILIYEFLQFIADIDPFYALDNLDKLTERYPQEDYFYYMYAHIAFNLFYNSDFEDEEEKNLIKSLFDKFIKWFFERTKKELPVNKLNANWIYYSCAYAEILLAEGREKSKADIVLQIAALNMDKIIESELSMVDNIEIVLLQYFEYFLYVSALYYSFLYEEDLDEILENFKKSVYNPNRNFEVEGYPFLTVALRTIYKFPFLANFNLEHIKKSAFFNLNEE